MAVPIRHSKKIFIGKKWCVLIQLQLLLDIPKREKIIFEKFNISMKWIIMRPLFSLPSLLTRSIIKLITKEFCHPLQKKNVYGEYLWNANVERRPFSCYNHERNVFRRRHSRYKQKEKSSCAPTRAWRSLYLLLCRFWHGVKNENKGKTLFEYYCKYLDCAQTHFTMA